MTPENVMRVLVLAAAAMFHYHFIVNRLKSASEEAIQVLENLPDGPEN